MKGKTGCFAGDGGGGDRLLAEVIVAVPAQTPSDGPPDSDEISSSTVTPGGGESDSTSNDEGTVVEAVPTFACNNFAEEEQDGLCTVIPAPSGMGFCRGYSSRSSCYDDPYCDWDCVYGCQYDACEIGLVCSCKRPSDRDLCRGSCKNACEGGICEWTVLAEASVASDADKKYRAEGMQQKCGLP